MAITRFTPCCLIVFLLTAWLSNAHVNRGTVVEAVSKRKGAAAVALDQTLRRWKMAVVKPEKVKAGATNVGRTSIPSLSKHDGTCVSQAKRAMNTDAECKEKHIVREFSEEVDEKEFVAFNADYRAPRHHPPKNN